MMSLGLSLGAFADGLASGYSMANRVNRSGKSKSKSDGPLDLGAMTNAPGLGARPPVDGGTGVSASGAPSNSGAPSSPSSLGGLLDKYEGGGDYNTLFKFSNRDGGRFAGTQVSNMTLGDVYKFTDPSGDYGQWVAANNDGVVATPVGKNQFVGTTLRKVATKMGLPDDTPFNPATQDAMFNQHARDTLAGASTMAGKRAALRGQWVGLKNVPDDQLDGAILQFETPINSYGALPPIS